MPCSIGAIICYASFEQVILRRLSVFVGIFTLEAAQKVAADENEIDEARVIATIASLVEKSLVSADDVDTTMRYRLLDTTRAYLLGKLIESDELDSVERRRAVYFSDSSVNAKVPTRPISNPKGSFQSISAIFVRHWIGAFLG